MQGYQFGHIETWSRAGVAKQNGENPTHRRNGQRGWSPDEIMAEAERRHDASEHVGWSGLNPLIISGTCGSFDALRRAHDEAASVKVAFPYVCSKTGKKSVRKRKLRVDAHTLYTSLISLPVTSAEALKDKAKMKECLRAIRIAIKFEKRRIEDAGGEFAMAVVHLDESKVHVHIFGLDRQRGSVNGLHPGKAAIEDFRAMHGALAKTGTNLFQRSKRVYCNAMRGWQDDLHREFAGKVGLTRFGPKRGRLSRSAWVRAKQDAEARAQASADLRADREKRENLRRIDDLFKEREENIVATSREQEDQKGRIENRAHDLENRSQQLALQAGTVQEQADANAAEKDRLEGEDRALRKRREKDDRQVAEAREQVAVRGAEVDASLALIEAISEGLVAFGEGEEEGNVRTTEAARSNPSWRGLFARIKPAEKSLGSLIRRLGSQFRKMREAAREAGMSDARREARAELQDTRTLMESAVDAAGSVTAVAKKFATRLGKSDSDEMLGEIEAGLRRTAKKRVVADNAFKRTSASTRSLGGEEPME